jgi:hypothetical protein
MLVGILNRTQVHRAHQSLTKTHYPVSIFHANIRSLRNQSNYIIDIVEDFDIIFFTETHLDNSISDASLPGFEVPIKRDRNCSGGGIIFYFKSFVNVVRRQDLEDGELLECM